MNEIHFIVKFAEESEYSDDDIDAVCVAIDSAFPNKFSVNCKII